MPPPQYLPLKQLASGSSESGLWPAADDDGATAPSGAATTTGATQAQASAGPGPAQAPGPALAPEPAQAPGPAQAPELAQTPEHVQPPEQVRGAPESFSTLRTRGRPNAWPCLHATGATRSCDARPAARTSSAATVGAAHLGDACAVPECVDVAGRVPAGRHDAAQPCAARGVLGGTVAVLHAPAPIRSTRAHTRPVDVLLAAKNAAELLAAGCRVRPSRAPSLPKTPSGGRWRRQCLACRCCRGPTTHVARPDRPARARSRPERRRSACAPTDGVSAGPAPRRGSLVCRDQGHRMGFKRTSHAARACGWSARVVSRTSEDIVAGRRIVRFWRDPTTQDVCWTSITAAAYSSLPPSQQQCTDVSCIFWCVAWSLSFFPGIRKPHLTPVPLRVSCPGIARATLSLQALTACAWCSSCWAAR